MTTHFIDAIHANIRNKWQTPALFLFSLWKSESNTPALFLLSLWKSKSNTEPPVHELNAGQESQHGGINHLPPMARIPEPPPSLPQS